MEKSFAFFTGSSHPELARQVAEGLHIKLGKVSLSTFPDREIGIEILENVRGREVFVLQTIARRPNHYLMELLILVDALKRASARSICAVIPYFGYARQDRKGEGRVPITGKLVANMLERAGINRVLTMDLHAEQIQGFFDIPVDNLYARPILVKAVENLGLKDFVVVAPDLGSIKMARSLASIFKADFAIVDKRRVSAEHVEPDALIGSVKGKNVLLVDDMVSTGKTLKTAARTCKNGGAKSIFAIATHGVFAIERALEESAIEKMLVTNTIPSPERNFRPNELEVISVAPLFSQAIELILSDKSLSSLYQT